VTDHAEYIGSAEFIGTFWPVLGGCGSAVLSAAFPNLGIGLFGVALAFGLTVLTMAYAIGRISGCHLNPAVSVGIVADAFPPASLFLTSWLNEKNRNYFAIYGFSWKNYD
jgi:glycerol uptake facilitator-like aquaporin